MPLSKPTVEDQRKLHAEVNQIVNQRFLIASAAVTVFGVAIAWILPKAGSKLTSDDITFAYTGAAVLSLLLFLLYWLSHISKAMLRIITTYLDVTGVSGWEKDWSMYRKRTHFAYTKPQTVVFLVLNALTILFPFLIIIAHHLEVELTWGAALLVILGALVELLMYLMGFQRLFEIEGKAAESWTRLDTEEAPAAVQTSVQVMPIDPPPI